MSRQVTPTSDNCHSVERAGQCRARRPSTFNQLVHHVPPRSRPYASRGSRRSLQHLRRQAFCARSLRGTTISAPAARGVLTFDPVAHPFRLLEQGHICDQARSLRWHRLRPAVLCGVVAAVSLPFCSRLRLVLALPTQAQAGHRCLSGACDFLSLQYMAYRNLDIERYRPVGSIFSTSASFSTNPRSMARSAFRCAFCAFTRERQSHTCAKRACSRSRMATACADARLAAPAAVFSCELATTTPCTVTMARAEFGH
jgi:hypothetical protein